MFCRPTNLAIHPRRGMVTAQVAMSMGVLMAVLALVTDGGILLVERRHAQATADAAALAAASDLYVNWNANQGLDPSGTANASALGVASANGYSNNGTTSTVTVTIPQAGYAQVSVTYYVSRGFSGVFGSGAIPVSAAPWRPWSRRPPSSSSVRLRARPSRPREMVLSPYLAVASQSTPVLLTRLRPPATPRSPPLS